VAWDRRNPGSWAELAEISAQVAGRVWSHGIMPNGARVSDTTTLARFQAAEPFLNETRDAYRESLRLRPRAADVHERLGRFLSGMESARLAVRRETGQAPAVGGTNGARGSDGSLVPEALVHFREAIRWDPQNAYYHRSLGLFAQRFSVDQGGRDIASEALGQALALRPDFLPGIVDALLARRVDDGSLIAAMPRKFEVFLDLGRVLEERGRHRTATAAFEEAVRLAQGPAQEVEARVTYARVLVARKETLAALDQARSALVAAPREAEVFALLALIHAQMKKDSEAETALATAVSLAESGPPSRRNRLRGELAALYVSRGQWDRAMGLWREVLRERPNDGWAHFELGRMLERAGDAAGALQEYKTVSAVAGDAWDLHHLVARALRDAGYLREAVASYETAQRINPTDADLGAELGDLYARIGLGQRAIEQYRLVLQREPDHLGARRGLANVRAGAAGS
jgi:tetratricopeptide (TPR) repeat protein